MRTVDEHNAERSWIHKLEQGESKSGVACPKCGAELLANRSISLTTDPPQTPVRCPECGHSGSIIS